MHNDWTVYLLRCCDGSYYVGHTKDLEKRISLHNSGRGAAYTAARRPVTLAFQESATSKSDAIKREKQIKRWSKAKKEALIQGNIALLKKLSRSHSD
ncbi:MAG: GIY-YIG nuclease family protein [Deltaproteobacteria bacterium]|nr:GIY-YIG nuclease family protein [Deltaproteobacteria bacterium]